MSKLYKIEKRYTQYRYGSIIIRKVLYIWVNNRATSNLTLGRGIYWDLALTKLLENEATSIDTDNMEWEVTEEILDTFKTIQEWSPRSYRIALDYLQNKQTSKEFMNRITDTYKLKTLVNKIKGRY
jgi:16S rRNA C1402 N4-methylase RsmH